MVENLSIRLAISRWGKWQRWYWWSQPCTFPAKSRCRMHLKNININRNPFKQVAFQWDCEDSKVTTNLQKVRQEKKTKHMLMGKKKKNQSLPNCAARKVPFFFGRLLQTGPPPDWSAWTSRWVLGMRSLSKSKKNRWKRGCKPKANVQPSTSVLRNK